MKRRVVVPATRDGEKATKAIELKAEYNKHKLAKESARTGENRGGICQTISKQNTKSFEYDGRTLAKHWE